MTITTTSKPTTDVWYDRQTRSWVVQRKDAEGNQIGDATFVATKAEAEAAAGQFKIDRSKVLSVYSGKAGKCCCGCAGKHSYASAHREVASTKRGYRVDDDEVSDRSVAIVCGKIEKLVNSGQATLEESDRGTYASVTHEGRLYIAYFG